MLDLLATSANKTFEILVGKAPNLSKRMDTLETCEVKRDKANFLFWACNVSHCVFAFLRVSSGDDNPGPK